MRPGKGCVSCRERHLKCAIEPDKVVCTRCLEANRECNFEPKFKFRPVLHVESPARASRPRQELSYSKDQVWVPTRKHFSFIIEDGAGLEYGVPDGEDDFGPTSQLQSEFNTGKHLGSESISGTAGNALTSERVRNSAPIIGILNVDTAATGHDIDASESNGSQSMGQDHGTLCPPRSLATQAEFATPATIEELSRRHDEESRIQSPGLSVTPLVSKDNTGVLSPSSLPTLGSMPRPNLSRREAYLIQFYINKIGPWADVCDLTSHFTHELPRRAMRNPMVLYSILAVTSRHLSIINGDPEQAEASFYHGQCIRLVIDQLSGPESLYDDNLLATVVCMRIYEEIEANNGDSLHLRGTDRLLRAIPTFAHSGGLGEAACWQSLRQDIYVSMVRNEPPSLHLENFEQSSVFTFRDDAACANVVVLLFAKILKLAYTSEGRADASAWNRLSLDVETWNDRRLRVFQPIYYEDLQLGENRPFPVIHMINPPQVAAMQYYHACKTYLLLHKPESETISHFHAAKKRRALERDISYHLVAIIGLAESNPFVENANFTAHHLLRVSGYCITHALQRTRAVEFLERVEQVMGWNTNSTILLLKEQWSDLDNPTD